MAEKKASKEHKMRGHSAIAQSHSDLAEVITQTVRLWRKAHLDYDQTKYIVEQARRRLQLDPPRTRRRSVERLDRAEVERLITSAYQINSKYGLMIKTLSFPVDTRQIINYAPPCRLSRWHMKKTQTDLLQG